MAKINKKSIKQFVSGFFATYAMWTVGLVMSGCILFVEMIEFFDSPPFMSVAFSFLFMVALIVSAVLCAKKQKKTFFIGMMFAVAFPIISQIIAAGVFALCDLAGSLGAAEWFLVPFSCSVLLFYAPAFSFASINYRWATIDIGEVWPEYTFIAVMLMTFILPIAVYIIISKKSKRSIG